MDDKKMKEALGSIWLAVLGALFFSEGYRAISIVTEEGGKSFIFLDQPGDRHAFENALNTAVGEIAGVIGNETVTYN